MKLLIVGDVHWSQYSSSLRKRGISYSERLETLIKTINWVEELSEKKICDSIIYLGDFFDKPKLNDEEISALKEIKWNTNIVHYFIVGNHESSVNGLRYNSTTVLQKSNFNIVSEPTIWKYNNDENEICFLPYIIEDDRKHLDEYFGKPLGNRIIFSHNDLKGINFGAFESKTGFDISEIEGACSLFINGHLHNGEWINNKIRNLGNVCGQNFGENADVYKHNVMILNTDTLEYEDVENPHGYNFIQREIKTEDDLNNLNINLSNSVINFKCGELLVSKLKSKLSTFDSISNFKITVVKDNKSTLCSEDVTLNLNDNYLQKFSECIINKLGNSDIVKEELSEVCK